ncbi:MAG TPA: exosortase K [Polyangiaceae bacterium]|nr:exosortase K [Polyangiaceae bacterium]
MNAWLGRHAVRLGSVSAAFAIAWLLKHHYSHASADALRWILAPTTWLTSFVLGGHFQFLADEGYLSREHSILISPACAGVNFLVVAFLSLVLGFGSSFNTARRALAWLAGALAIAYVTTLFVNTARIALSVAVAHLAAHALGLTFHSVHRWIGIAVYLAGLLALCLTLHVWLSSRGARFARSATLLVALACYVSVTLVVPLLGGAAHTSEYWSHAVPVSVSVGVVVALVFAARGRSWKNGRHAIRPPECSERFAEELGTR